MAEIHVHADVRVWLWSFLRPRADQLRLFKAAIAVANQSQVDKQILLAWIDVTSNVEAQFKPNPSQWAEPPTSLAAWPSFKELMLAFYERMESGLPFDENGNVAATQGVTYSRFVDDYKASHGDRACVLCGGPLGRLEVDHWIDKASFPVLAISPANLLPTCRSCNAAPAKGTKPVFRSGVPLAFAEWFHPYFFPGHGRITISYDDAHSRVISVAHNPADTCRSNSLDNLLNLGQRWTAEFKARHRSLQRSLKQLVSAGRLERTEISARQRLDDMRVAVVANEPNSEIELLLIEHAEKPHVLSVLLEEM